MSITTVNKLKSNVIGKEKLREVQKATLNAVSDYIMNSAGPNGSNTMIPHSTAFTTYSKDGKTILENIKFIDTIENSIVQELVEVAAHVVTTVGDGTTSVVVLASKVFNALCEFEKDGNHMPYEIISDFIKVSNDLKEIINNKAKEVTPEEIYKISMISTNGNNELSQNIKYIYEKYGNEVFINVGVSNTSDTVIKAYDGLTIPYGYINANYINTNSDHSCHIRNANIYAFKDNVDTPEMIAFFDKIVYTNIITPSMTGEGHITPTVIMCPMISRDLSSTLDTIEKIMYACDQKSQSNMKPPLLVITDIMTDDRYEDLAKLCDCKLICKYINPERQKEDIEAGIAPTIENITTFSAGFAEEVISNKDNTTFINPELMYQKNEDGTYVYDNDLNPIISDFYNNMVKGLEEELQSLIDNNAKLSKITEARRRLNNLKANMVDFFIGGITTTDRDSVRHLAEDAIYNCRSAASKGYGYGANFEAYLAILQYCDKYENSEYGYILKVLKNAYEDLILSLYRTRMKHDDAVTELKDSINMGMPINLRTLKYDDSVLSSIMSDQVILDCIAKIVSIMFTCNQAIVENPVYNVYEN